MRKKRGIGVVLALVILGIFLFSGAVIAQDSVSPTSSVTPANIGDSFQCLDDLIEDREAEDLALSEAIFAVLAAGAEGNLLDAIEAEEDNDCWPLPTCRLKETGQVLLAYDRVGRNTRGIESWVSDQNSTVSGLDWLLQIDITTGAESECTIRDGTTDRKVTIAEDGKVSGTLGGCFSVDSSGNWVRVLGTEACTDEEFSISCEEDFVTSILYRRTSAGTIFVGSEVNSAAGFGTVTQEVTGKCLSTGSGCDYEGTLWAALGLHKSGVEIDAYIPYLNAFADDNSKFFPSAFLYILTGDNTYFSDIVQRQKQNQFWQISGSPYNRFYDTSLATLALSGENSQELDNAKEYLLEIRTEDGCWNNDNLRDTSFVLYGAFGRGSVKSSGSGIVACGEGGFSCGTPLACGEAGGEVFSEFDCSAEGFGQVCCSVFIAEASCGEQGGLICGSGESCTGGSVSSSDGSCCLGSCEVVSTTNACEDVGGYCAFSCESGDAEGSQSCGTGSSRACCIPGAGGGLGGGTIALIIILIILIGLIVFAIIKRDKIRLWMHRRKGKHKVRPITKPGAPAYRPPRAATRARAPAVKRRPGAKETEFEETLRKLKDIGK